MPVDKIIKLLEEKIKKANKKFKRVIIFWIDLEKQYTSTIVDFKKDNFRIEQHTKFNQFQLKKLIEIDEAETNFIIYRDEEIKENENWLLDIEIYSDYFSPDVISILIDELEVKESLKMYFRKYSKFFSNEKRKDSFISYYDKTMTAKDLFYSFLTVIFKAKNVSQYEILKAVITAALNGKNILKDLEKYDMKDAFIKLLSDEYGVDISKITIENFVERLLLCHFDYKIKRNNFNEIIYMNKNSGYLAVEYLLKDDEFKSIIKPILNRLEKKEIIIKIISELHLNELVKVSTFDFIDKEIIDKMISQMNSVNIQPEYLINLIYQRKSESYNFKKYITEYNVIESALQITYKIRELKFDDLNSVSILINYSKNYYKIDTLYRKFYLEYEKLSDKDYFLEIQEKIELEYNNNYNRYLSEYWETHLEKNWFEGFEIKKILRQHNFYEKEIEPFIRKKNRIYVIISDALRYEAGLELAEKLAKEASEKVKVETEPVIVSLPSITKIGMSALLPQKNTMYNNGEITVNGISVNGSINRGKILKSVVPESMVISYKDIINLKKEELSERVKGKYVVYIYHDVIDAIGDNYKTEDKVFDAVETTIEELKKLVLNLNSKVNAINIFVTADHGFLYQRTQLKEYNKLEKYDFNIIDQGKRFILSKDDVEDETLIKVNMDYIFKDENLNAYIPHRNTRIKQQGGGSKFVHGGISLQELVVPLVRFKYMKNYIEKKQKVNVELLNTNRVIANNLIKLEFMQKEKVDSINKVFKRKISLALFDKNEMISDEKILILDSEGDKISSREFETQLHLKNKKYELYKKYQLKITDVEDGELIESYDFDIRFNNF